MIEPDISIPTEEIQNQVEKICSSVELVSKPQLCRLLRYLVGETLKGRGDSLKGFTIGVELFGKDDSFDPAQDPIVRIHAGRLRRMLKMYYLDAGKGDPVRIEIDLGQYVPRFSYVRDPADTPGYSFHEKRTKSGEPVIAILPFKNISGDPARDFFALGFSEELSVELTRFEHLTIIDGILLSGGQRSSQEDLEMIRSMGIRFVIEGSVNIDDNHVKILVKLSDVVSWKKIWTDSYTRELTMANLIGIQENIVQDIASELGTEYGIILQRMSLISGHQIPQILDTYQAILKFYYFEAHQTAEASWDAFQALELALKKEPGSGMATAMLASLHGNRYSLDLPGAEESFEKMTILAERAEMLDPNSLIVRVIVLWKCFVHNEKERFFREVDRCLAMNPHPSMRLLSIGFHLSLYGDWERGKSLLDRVMSKNFYFPGFYYGATMLYYYRRKEYERAYEEAIKYNAPGIFWGPMLRTAVLGQLNRKEEALPQIAHLKQLKPDFEKKSRYLISRFVKEPELVDHILDGLQKAGVF